MITDIVSARKRLGVTMQQVARRAGIVSSTLSRIERGRRRGRAQTIQAIVAALEIIALEQNKARARLAAIGQPETERDAA